MKYPRSTIFAIALLLTVSCSSATARHKMTVASSGLYAAIATIDDTEHALYTPGTPCVQPAPCLTKDQHDTLAPDILALLQAGKAANDVILVIGDPVPQPMQAVVAKLKVVADRVVALLPDGPTKSKLQTAILGAQTAATLLLAFLPSTPVIGALHGTEPQHDLGLGPGWAAARADREHRVFTFENRARVPRDRSRYRAA